MCEKLFDMQQTHKHIKSFITVRKTEVRHQSQEKQLLFCSCCYACLQFQLNYLMLTLDQNCFIDKVLLSVSVTNNSYFKFIHQPVINSNISRFGFFRYLKTTHHKKEIDVEKIPSNTQIFESHLSESFENQTIFIYTLYFYKLFDLR